MNIVKRNAELLGDGAGVGDSFGGTTTVGVGLTIGIVALFGPQTQHNADHIVTLLNQQRRRY